MATSLREPERGAVAGASASVVDPRSAILAYLFALLATLGTVSIVPLAGLCALALALALGPLRAGRALAAMLRGLWLMLAILALASWWEGGLPLAVSAILRVVCLSATSVVLFAVISPDDLAGALRAWHVPYRVTFVLSGGVRFIPLIAQTYHDLREMQEARGIMFTPFWRHVRAYRSLLAPLLREVFLTAERLAQALEVRGFSAPHRTSAFAPRWRPRDALLCLVACGGCALMLRVGR